MAAEPSIGRAARVEGARAPEAELTRALYEQYGNQIFRYCLHQLGSREEAEDAVQSTFLNAFRGIKRGIVPELESAWLFKIAQNVCLSRRRSTWRRDRIESPTDFELVQELTPAPSRRADELMGLQAVLEQMPENQRRAILLREWQGLSYHEIAAELELSQAAVETLIFRARRALAQGLEQPPAPKKRLARGADWGNVLAGLKSLLLGGGAAVKLAATVAVVSATTVVATAPVIEHHAGPHTTRASSAAPASTAAAAHAAHAATSVSGVTVSRAGGVPTLARRHHAAKPVRARQASSTSSDVAVVPPAADTMVAAAAPVAQTQAAPAAAAAPAQPASGSSAGGQADSTPTVVVKAPVEVKDGTSGTPAVAAAPVTEPASSADDSSSGSSGSSGSSDSSDSSGSSAATPTATPTSQQTPVVAPVTTTLSAPPAGDNASNPALVLPPAATKKLDSAPGSTPGNATPAGSLQPPAPTTPITPPAGSAPPAGLSVQPPATTSGHTSVALNGASTGSNH